MARHNALGDSRGRGPFFTWKKKENMSITVKTHKVTASFMTR